MTDLQSTRRPRTKAKDITGVRFTRLVALHITRKTEHSGNMWLCRCDCGTVKEVVYGKLLSSNTKSCGCLKKKISLESGLALVEMHRLEREERKRLDPLTPEQRRTTYNTWRGMKERCHNPNNNHWHIYGTKGITVCEKWQQFSGFLEDMGPRPKGMSLDRIDGNGNYEPGNCRWATPSQQSRNTERNIWLEWQGRRQTFKDWATELGLYERGLAYRIERWGLEKAMTTPKIKSGEHIRVLTDDQVLHMRKVRAIKGSRWGAKEFAENFNVTVSAIRQAVCSKSFKHLPKWETFK